MNFRDWKGDGAFGCWETDSFGAPSYLFYYDRLKSIHSAHTTETRVYSVPWHNVGNQRISATAHADGCLQLYSADRGLSCITPRQPLISCSGAGLGLVEFDDGTVDLLRSDTLPRAAAGPVRFGIGYSEYSFRLDNADIRLRHWAPEGRLPVIVTDVSFDDSNSSKKIRKISLLSSIGYWFIDMDPFCSGVRRENYGPPPVGDMLGFITKNVLYPMNLTTDCRRAKFARSFSYKTNLDDFVSVQPGLLRDREFDPSIKSRRQPFPMMFFAKAPEDWQPGFELSEGVFNGDKLDLAVSTFRKDNKPRMFNGPVVMSLEREVSFTETNLDTRIVWGYGPKCEAAEAIKSAMNSGIEENIASRLNRAVRFSIPDLPWVEREWIWHSDNVRNLAYKDEYTDTVMVKQASAYFFVQGVEGTTRDHALYAVPLVYFDRELARGMIEYTLKCIAEDGRFQYGMHGYGITAGFGLHDWPTDLPMAFLWAVTEYIFATRDFEILDDEFEYYPRGCEKRRTLREAIRQACDYLLEQIGTGPNGLMRVGTGDWNDPLQLHVRNRTVFKKKGESVYNSAMAVYVFPRVASLVDAWDEDYAQRLRQFGVSMCEAVRQQWNGRWLYRAWDGEGRPLGRKSLYLEHSVWALVSRALPDDEAEQLVSAIDENLDAPSPIGAMVIAPPKKIALNIVPKGWDTNGGIWHAPNMLLTWGYGYYDKSLARRSLLKNTLCAHAEHYGNIWYGIWSAPDAYNASFAKHPGQTYSHFTPMSDFPVMNTNAHANPLTAAIKLCGIEPTAKGFIIQPLLPDEVFTIDTPLIKLSRGNNVLSCKYSSGGAAGVIEFEVRDAICGNDAVALNVNGKPAKFERIAADALRFKVKTDKKGKLDWELKI